MDFLLIAPEIWVLTMTCVILFVDAFIKEERRGIVHLLGMVTLIFAAIITLRFDYGAEREAVAFAGSFIRDPMGDMLKLFSYFVLAMVFIYAKFCLRQFRMFRSDFYTLSLEALVGIMLLISANNLIMVYLGLELLALSSYALVAYDRESRIGSEAAMKYFVLGSMASGMLLYGMSMIYGATGTLDLGAIAEAVKANGADDIMLVFGLVFLVVGIAFKFGAVPFHMWLPDVYNGARSPVTLYVATAPKVAAFALTFRILVDGLGGLHPVWNDMVMVIAVLSLLIGNIVAIAQTNIKRMLAYSTIGHVGFILLGIFVGTEQGYAAALFYTLTYVLTAAAAFGIIIVLSRKGYEAESMTDFRGLNARSPWFALIMMFIMFSMAGIPPFVGFFGKLNVIAAVIDAGFSGLAVLMVLASVIGAFYYLRVIWYMYFEEAEDQAVITPGGDVAWFLSLNGLAILALGILPGWLWALCEAVMRGASAGLGLR